MRVPRSGWGGAAVAVAAVAELFCGAGGGRGGPPPTARASPAEPAAAGAGFGLGAGAALWLADAVRPRVALSAHLILPDLGVAIGVGALVPPGLRTQGLDPTAKVSETIWPFRV